MNQKLVIDETKSWIEGFVINLDLCPFASHPFYHDKIRYSVIEEKKSDQFETHIAGELAVLKSDPSIETSFILIDDPSLDFDGLLKLIDQAYRIMNEHMMDGIFQLIPFHPHFIFDGHESNDPINMVNRSPYPMIHILREDSVSDAQETYGDTSEITNINAQILRKLFAKKQ